MYKFDVKYTFDNYLEYYKFVLIKQRIYRDLIFCILFIGIAIFWWVDGGENTEGNFLPIFALLMGVVFPLMNLLTLPMLKKQLRSKQDEIDRTHVVVSFEENEIVYENLTKKVSKPAPVEEPAVEQIQEGEEAPIDNAPIDVEEKNENEPEERLFKLSYQNFMSVKETKNLFLFYLDRQTIIILPKETYISNNSLIEFKEFIKSKIHHKRIKFLKDKIEK